MQLFCSKLIYTNKGMSIQIIRKVKQVIGLTTVIIFIGISKLFGQVDHWETIVYDTSSWRYVVPSAATSMNRIQPGFMHPRGT